MCASATGVCAWHNAAGRSRGDAGEGDAAHWQQARPRGGTLCRFHQIRPHGAHARHKNPGAATATRVDCCPANTSVVAAYDANAPP
eukprot:5787779-Pleurochrysis_carterae.AAC.1